MMAVPQADPFGDAAARAFRASYPPLLKMTGVAARVLPEAEAALAVMYGTVSAIALLAADIEAAPAAAAPADPGAVLKMLHDQLDRAWAAALLVDTEGTA